MCIYIYNSIGICSDGQVIGNLPYSITTDALLSLALASGRLLCSRCFTVRGLHLACPEASISCLPLRGSNILPEKARNWGLWVMCRSKQLARSFEACLRYMVLSLHSKEYGTITFAFFEAIPVALGRAISKGNLFSGHPTFKVHPKFEVDTRAIAIKEGHGVPYSSCKGARVGVFVAGAWAFRLSTSCAPYMPEYEYGALHTAASPAPPFTYGWLVFSPRIGTYTP